MDHTNFLLPNNQPLNLNNRIVGGGVSIFKIKILKTLLSVIIV